MILPDKRLGQLAPTTIDRDGVIQQAQPSGPPHEGSRETAEGKITSVPKDYCWTPRGSSMVLVGYKIWAYQREATDLANSVRQATLRSHVRDSIILHCYGDEAGTGGGVTSGTHNAECTPKTWSETVRFQGRNAVRDSDEWWMNHRNTWGVLDYKKDTEQYDTSAPQEIDAKMRAISNGRIQLAEAPMAEPDVVPDAEPIQEPPSAETASPGEADPSGGPTSSFARDNKPLPAAGLFGSTPNSGSYYNKFLPAPFTHVEHVGGDWWQLSDGSLVSTKRLNELWTQYKKGGRPSGAVRQTGRSVCPCLVGTYETIKPACQSANCGGQAHHIVADKYLRVGTRPKPGAVDPGRIKGMPTLDEGPSICLNGNAGDEDSDHNIAHQNDGLIQALGSANKPQGTLPIGQIREISVEAAKAAAPDDAACKAKIDAQTGIEKYGGKPGTLVRATNDPPAAGSDAMKYFRPPQPIQK